MKKSKKQWTGVSCWHDDELKSDFLCVSTAFLVLLDCHCISIKQLDYELKISIA